MRDHGLSYFTPRSELGQAWGEWLSGLALWQWWVTLTFRDPGPNTRGWDRPGWAWAKRGWADFQSATRPAVGRLVWVRGFEVHRWRGAPHIHALVGGLDSLRYAEVGLWWWQHYGLCHIEEYNAHRGAGYYLCKYVSKQIADIEFGGLTRPNGGCIVEGRGGRNASTG